MRTIASASPHPVSLEVTWDDGVVTRYPWIWIRDHAHDDRTLHPVTQQRQLFTASLPIDLVGTTISIADDALTVAWNDSSADSVLPVTFLEAYRVPHTPRAAVSTKITQWDAASIAGDLPTVAFDHVMHSDDGVAEWLTKTIEFGFCIAVGTPPTAVATEALLRRIGYVRETIFGGMWEFTADLTKADTA